MRTCLSCGTANADDATFCRQCGQPLGAGGPPDATVRWTGAPLRAEKSPRRQVPVEVLFARKSRLVIGRAPECEICLPHPTVSRYHALLERLPEGFRLRDLNSINGVSVDGRRIAEPVLVREHQRVG